MKNRTLRIILDLVLIIVGIVFLIFGIKDAYNLYMGSKIDDSVRFNKSYPTVKEDNIIEYVDLKEANKLFEKGSGILLIGFTLDPWMQVLIKPTYEYLENKVNTIYYLEIDEIDENSKNYSDILEKITEISSPSIVIFKDKEILTEYHKQDIIDKDYDGAPIEYFDEERTRGLEEKLNRISELK